MENPYIEQQEALIRDLIAEIKVITAERDALQAWKDAVPVDDIALLQERFTPRSLNELRADSAVVNWLATLDGAT